MRTILLLIVLLAGTAAKAQQEMDKMMDDITPKTKNTAVSATFKSPQIINVQSSETVHHHDLLFVVMHRFSDIAGTFGGVHTFYGLDNSTDILIGFDYGLSDRLSLGVGRTKGTTIAFNTQQKQLFYLKSKYRFIRQTADNSKPFSLTLFGNAVISAMQKDNQATSDANFQKFTDRMSFVAQAIFARKFSENLSLEILPTYVRRNYVTFMDMNDLFGIGVGGRMKVTHRMSVIADYFLSLRSQQSKDYFLQQNGSHFYNPLGIGLEIETGGHVFNFIFTNSTAILENQFIPSTSSSWTKGGFRWGFSISRTFTLKKEPGKPL